MINNDYENGGIYRALLISHKKKDSDELEVRVYIPGHHSGQIIDVNNNLLYEFDQIKNMLSEPLYCAPNTNVLSIKEIHPCWVTFENGDLKHPVVMGFLGDGMLTSVSGSSGDPSSGSPTGDDGSDYNPDADGGKKTVDNPDEKDVLIVPDGYGTVCTYEKEIINKNATYHGWASSSNQGALRKSAIDNNRMRQGDIFGLKNCAIIDDRLMIATKINIGGIFPVEIGDYLDVEFSDGTIWNCILGDAKGADADSNWGHNGGASVVEIIYWDYSTNSGNIYKKVSKITKVGKYV